MKSLTTALPLLDEIREALPADCSIFLVGGAVRDILLGQEPHDLDFVLPGKSLATCRRVADRLQAPFFPLDEERDIGRIIFTTTNGSRLTLDFAAFRGPDLESDLRDRDFTVNAMAIDLYRPQTLFDPLGGAQDLRKRVLRACSAGSLSSDPVRILRGVRQAVNFEFRMTPDTLSLARQALPLLSQVSIERLRDELFRIFEIPKAVTALRTLDILGALDQVLPEMAALKGTEQPQPHVADVWTHTLHTAQQMSDLLGVLALKHDPDFSANWTMGLVSLRLGRYRQQLDQHLNTPLNAERPLRSLLLLAALYHDVGKPQTRQVDEKGRIRFLEHEQTGYQIVRKRGAYLRLSNLEIDRLGILVRHHMRPLLLAQAKEQLTSRAIYRFFRDTGEAGIDVCLLALADILATYGPTLPQETWTRQLDVIRSLLEAWWEQPEKQVTPPPLLTGKDLMLSLGITPGPQIGILLEAIREAQAAGELQDREQALEFARSYKP